MAKRKTTRRTTRSRKRKVRVALIGAGMMANKVHYPSLVSFDDVEIVGLCDLIRKKLNATAKKFGIAKTYLDYHKMLDEVKPDAVYVLMPPHELFNIAADVLERGIALFVEKPPSVTTDQTAALAAIAAETGALTAVGFQRRYHPLAVKCYDEVVKHGKLNQVEACFYKAMEPQPIHPYYRGAIDILRCDAIHAVDALRYYAGLSEVASVSAVVRKLDAWYPVSWHALVHFENDVVGVLEANWRSGRRLLQFEFHSGGGFAQIDADGIGNVWAGGADPVFTDTHTNFVGSDEEYIHQGFRAENRAFIDSVKSGKPVHNTIADAVKTMELADMIYEAAGCS